MTDCPLLRELDAWFSLALDLLATEPGVRRDVLLLVGGAASVTDVARVTAADCVTVGDHLLVFPPGADGRSLPLTPAFVEVTGLSAAAWPVHRADPDGDAQAVTHAVATVDAALARISGYARPTGPERLRALRMHAWHHELGSHVGVLARCYGGELVDLLSATESCASADVAHLVPLQRHVTAAVA